MNQTLQLQFPLVKGAYSQQATIPPAGDDRWPGIYSFLQLLLGDDAAAADAFRETQTSAALSSLRRHARLADYYAIALAAGRTIAQRDEQPTPRILSCCRAGVHAIPAPVRTTRSGALQAALSLLDFRERAIVILYHSRALTIDEIARVMRRPRLLIWAQLLYATRGLATYLTWLY